MKRDLNQRAEGKIDFKKLGVKDESAWLWIRFIDYLKAQGDKPISALGLLKFICTKPKWSDK